MAMPTIQTLAPVKVRQHSGLRWIYLNNYAELFCRAFVCKITAHA